MEFPLDFPDGMTYTVGKSRWPIDWNYVLPSAPDRNGGLAALHSGKIVFDLATRASGRVRRPRCISAAPATTAVTSSSASTASTSASADGVTAAPQPIDASGFNPAYFDDASIHLSDHGPFSDERINFPAKLLHAGQNTITIQMDARKLTAYLMLDYLRLELSGYVPPPPARVTAYAGNNRAAASAGRWCLARRVTICFDRLPATADTRRWRRGSSPPSAEAVQAGGQYVDATAANGSRVFLQGAVGEPRRVERDCRLPATPRSRRPSNPATCRPRRRISKSPDRATIAWPSLGLLRREPASIASGERRCMRTASAGIIPWAAFCSTTP